MSHEPAIAPDKEGEEQTHYIKMVVCNLAGGACVFAAGGFTGNFLLMGAGVLQVAANGLFLASMNKKRFSKKRCHQLQKLAYKLFAANSVCSIAAGVGLGEIANPLGLSAMRPEMLVLGAFGLGGGLAGAMKQEPADNQRTKLVDLFCVGVPGQSDATPRLPRTLKQLTQINALKPSTWRTWWRGLDSNKAATSFYMVSGAAPLVAGLATLGGVAVAGAAGAVAVPAAVVTAAVISVGIGVGYTLGNFCLGASRPRPESAPATSPSPSAVPA